LPLQRLAAIPEPGLDLPLKALDASGLVLQRIAWDLREQRAQRGAAREDHARILKGIARGLAAARSHRAQESLRDVLAVHVAALVRAQLTAEETSPRRPQTLAMIVIRDHDHDVHVRLLGVEAVRDRSPEQQR